MSDDGSMSATTGFYAPMVDAYSFRCLMDFIGATLGQVHFTFTNHAILMKQRDTYGTIIHNMVIHTDHLVDYYLNPEYESVSVGVDMRTFRSKIKNAQKKQTVLTLFNDLTLPTEFYATFKVPNKKNIPMSVIPTVRMAMPMDIATYDYSSMDPSIIVQVTEVSNTFGYIATSKCQYAELDCYERGILIKGLINGRVDTVETLGRCVNPYMVGKDVAAQQNGVLVEQYTLSNTHIKPFAKINNISPATATVRLYYVKGQPLRIVFPIGTIGTHECLMTSIDPQSLRPVAAESDADE
jgi:hypothetical protein